MRRITAAGALVIALLACSTASAVAALSGTYNATITKSGPLRGAWSLTFSGSKYTISFKGAVAVNGAFTQSGSKITFSDRGGKYACPGKKGVYSYALNGHTLTFKRVSDAQCAGRQVVLGATFAKKFGSGGHSGY